MSTKFATKFSSGGKVARQRDYSHPSVVALLQTAGQEADPEEIVRRKCREIVAFAKADGWGGPPFNPFILASLRGIKVKSVTREIGGEARIFGTAKQVIIEYRPDMALEERIRFSICHEIVHTIFPNCFEMVRHIKPGDSNMSDAEREFERLCDVGAGELLMPHEEFSADLQETTFGLTDVCNLKKKYFASAEATVNRCLGLTHLPRAAVFFHKPQQLLTVKYYWKSNTFRPFIQPGLVPPTDSVIHQLPASTSTEPMPPVAQREIWFPENGRPIELHVQVMPLPPVPQQPNYPSAMALVVPCLN